MPKIIPIRERLKELHRFQPSVIRNSIVMSLLQFSSFLGSIIFIAYGIWMCFGNEKKELAGMYLIAGLFLLLICKLTKMVRMRNAYIMDLNELLDDETE